jgi:hypothetical protein
MSNVQMPPPPPPAQNDTGSFGWAVLGFFIPIVGLILWLVWKDTRPKDSIQSRNGFIAGLIVGVIFSIIYTIAMSALIASAGY